MDEHISLTPPKKWQKHGIERKPSNLDPSERGKAPVRQRRGKYRCDKKENNEFAMVVKEIGMKRPRKIGIYLCTYPNGE